MLPVRALDKGDRVDEVMLLGHGGPATEQDLLPFARRVLGQVPAGPQAVEAVVAQYRAIGGISPFNAAIGRQADALAEALKALGRPLPVTVGLLHAAPLISQAFERAAGWGRRHILAVPMVPFQSPSGWGRYVASLEAAVAACLGVPPRVSVLEPWGNEDGHVQAAADRARFALEGVEGLAPSRRASAQLLFSAHAIPEGEAEHAPYAPQFSRMAAAVAGRLGLKGFTLAYQSRPLQARGKWLAPTLEEEIGRLGKAGASAVLLCPLGFICDSKEVLYDMDVLARAAAAEAGLPFARAGTVGDHPAFIGMLADRVLRGWKEA